MARIKMKQLAPTAAQTLVAMLFVFEIGWLVNRLKVLALCYYLTIKQYSPPNQEEMRASIEFVLRRMLIH